MVVTERMVYLQLQKTGSTHIAELLRKLYGARQLAKHGALHGPTDKYVAGSIRNPWAWYVSLWAFGCRRQGALYSDTMSQPRLWQRCYQDASDAGCFRDWLRLLYDPQVRLSLTIGGYQSSSIASFAGLLTFRYCLLYLAGFDRHTQVTSRVALQSLDRDTYRLSGVIRCERLETDLLEVLREAGHAVDETIVEAVRSAAGSRLNATTHFSPCHYYDAATATLVRTNEYLICERFGYSAVE